MCKWGAILAYRTKIWSITLNSLWTLCQSWTILLIYYVMHHNLMRWFLLGKFQDEILLLRCFRCWNCCDWWPSASTATVLTFRKSFFSDIDVQWSDTGKVCTWIDVTILPETHSNYLTPKWCCLGDKFIYKWHFSIIWHIIFFIWGQFLSNC